MRRPQPFYKRMRYVLETVLVYIVFFFFRLLPLNAASALGGSLFKAIGPLLSSSKTAYKGLSLAFPDKPADEKKLIVKLMWENLGRVAGEYPHLDEVADNVELEGGHYLEAARDSGKPVIFFGAHLANWEVPTVVAKKIGLDIYPVYRRPNNTGVENLLRKARGPGAVEQIPKGASGARQMLSVLRKGGALAVLVDQKLNEGMAVPFFGVNAMTTPSIASFALKFKCPLHPVCIERTSGAKFKMTVYPPLDIKPSGNNNEDIKVILTEANRHIEGWVAKNPSQWLWLHKRWPKELYK